MKQQEFNTLLSQANLSKKQFAQMIGIAQQSVNNWGSSKNIPYWVEGYLRNYIELKKYQAIREKIEELGIFEEFLPQAR